MLDVFASCGFPMRRKSAPGGERVEVALTPTPEARATKHQEPDSVEGPAWGWSLEAAQSDDGSWCVTDSTWGGDSGGSSRCLLAGVGITSGSVFFAGGSSQDLIYTLVR